ncbi:hypothetical protein CXF97_17665 [Pseudomonas sp. Choline-02u-1]|nr:hypothetical protein CXF97_17665 [Pseudomonas sp. Choline-02u-1]
MRWISQQMCRLSQRLREQAPSHTGFVLGQRLRGVPVIPVGAGLLANASGQSMQVQADPTPLGASPSHTGFVLGRRSRGVPVIPVGAGLLANASGQSMQVQAEPTPSRASPSRM